MKKGPRRSQKFYYFPLKPVRGSHAEYIVRTNVHARYVSRIMCANIVKMKPQYYTLASPSLGRVEIGEP